MTTADAAEDFLRLHKRWRLALVARLVRVHRAIRQWEEIGANGNLPVALQRPNLREPSIPLEHLQEMRQMLLEVLAEPEV